MDGRAHQQFSLNRNERSLEAIREKRKRAELVLRVIAFGSFRLFPHARLLERDTSPVPLSSRAFDLLCILVGRPGETISKSELMAKTWPDVTVEESSLRFHIAQLRRALGENHGGERYVVNVPGRGYCFVAYVSHEAVPMTFGHVNKPTPSARQLAAI